MSSEDSDVVDPEVAKADALRQSVIAGDWKEFVRVVTSHHTLNGKSPLVFLMEWFHQWQQEYEALLAVLDDQLHQEETEDDSQLDLDIEEMEEEARHVFNGFGDIALQLAQQVTVSGDLDQMVDKYGWTLLMQAANSGLGPLMEFLITTANVDVNFCMAPTNLNALFLAVQSDHTNEALLLLRHGAAGCATKVVQTKEPDAAKTQDQEEPDNGEDTALFQACRHGNTRILEQMLECGVDVNFRLPSSGDSALHVAAMYGMEDVVELLLNQTSIDVNSLNSSGQTCLFGCSIASIVQMLLHKGVDVSIKDSDNETAWTIAEALGDVQVAQLLQPNTTQ